MNWRNLTLLLLAANFIYWAWNNWIQLPSQEFEDQRIHDIPELEIVTETTQMADLESFQVDASISTAQTHLVSGSESNIDTDNVMSSAVAELPTENAIETVSADKTCHRVGYFMKKEEANAAKVWLAKRDIDASLDRKTQEVWLGYRVYLPAQPSRAEAVEMLETLRTKGVKDMYIMTKPPEENVIALGLFRIEEGAKQRVKEIEALGFEVIMAERRDQLPVYWVQFGLPKDQSVPISGLLKLLGTDAGRVQRLDRVDCR